MTSIDGLFYNEFYEARLACGLFIEALGSGVTHALDKGHDRMTIKYAIWHMVDEILEKERALTFHPESVLNGEGSV